MRALLDGIASDLRYGARALVRTPVFAVTAVLTLAIGIGATTAIFSAVYAVVLRPFPFHEPERLVRIYVTSPSTTQQDEASPRAFTIWRRENRSLALVAATVVRNFTFTAGPGLPEQVTGARATGDYFRLLGAAPALGRTFDREEDQPGTSRVAVLSHRFWTNRFGSDRAAIGRTIRLDGRPFVVIGVMPASVDLSSPPIDLWTPLALSAEAETYDETAFLDVVGRLRSGVTIAQAQIELADLTRRGDAGRRDVRRSARVLAYDADLTGPYRARLFILLGAVTFVLLIACVNVANLLLARGSLRVKELAVRSALGAGRARLMTHLFAESLVLGALGGGTGLLVAFGALAAVRGFAPADVPRLAQARMDLPSLGVALFASLASAFVFGVVQSLRAGRTDLQSVLTEAGRSGIGAGRDRARPVFIVVEVAFSLMLLVGAGLLVRTAIMVQRVDPGLRAANVWTGAVTFTSIGSPSAERIAQTAEQIIDGVERVPGVTSAAVVSLAPFTGLRALGMFVPEGRPIEEKNLLMGSFRLASPNVFRTLGIPLRHGRDFSNRDGALAPPVAIVNEAFARLAWPGERAIGKRLLGPGSGGPNERIYREVIGVVGATREDGLREVPRPAVYYPIRQASFELWESTEGSAFLVARTATSPLSITRDVRRIVYAVNRSVPVFAVRSMEERMADLAATARFNTALLATSGAVGLALAGIGIYGVIAYLVGERRREIGVRMALGATSSRVVALVVWQGMRPVLAGIGIGSLTALGLTRFLASQLYGIAPTDPITFVSGAGVLAIVASVAAAIPAVSASRVPPREALGT